MKAFVGITLGIVAGGSLDLDQVVIDGHDITAGINGLHLDARVGELTRLTVDFPVVSRTRFDGTVQAFVNDATRDALIVLGWTPPDGGPRMVRYWIRMDPDLMAEIAGDRSRMPACWTFGRMIRLPNEHNPHFTYLVEVTDTDAPSEADGLLLCPTLVTDPEAGTVTVTDYGLACPPASR